MRGCVWTLYIAIAFIGGVLLMGFLCLGPIPVFDRESGIFPAIDLEALSATVKGLAKAGVKIRGDLDTEKVKRTLTGRSMIFNFTDPELYERMGRPTAAAAFRTRKPLEAASQLVKWYTSQGFSAELIPDFDTDVKPGRMVGIKTNAVACGFIIFRRHVLLLGGKPKKSGRL